MGDNVPTTASLVEQFAQRATVFRLDVPQVQSLDVLGDPGIRDRIRRQGDIIIVTQENLRGVISQFKKGSADKYDTIEFFSSNSVKDFLASKTPEELKEISERFYRELEPNNPRIREQIKNLDIPRAALRRLEETYGGQVDVRAFIFMSHIQTQAKAEGYSVVSFAGQQSVFIPVGATREELERYSHGHVSRTLGEGGKYSQESGAYDQEHIARITLHEIEHALDGGQKSTADRVIEAFGETQTINAYWRGDFSQIYHHISSAREMEAYLAELTTTIFPESVHRRSSAKHISFGHESLWFSSRADDPAHIGESHAMLGYFGMEYLDTGHVPGYLDITTTVNGFYAHTKSFYFDALEKAGVPISDGSAMASPSIPVMMGVVQEALKANPPVYSPAEQLAAEHFLQATGDVLKIKPEDMSQHISKAVENNREYSLMGGQPSRPAQALTH